MGLIGTPEAAVDGTVDEKEDDKIVVGPRHKKKKKKNEGYYESSPSFGREDERNHSTSKSRVRAKREDF